MIIYEQNELRNSQEIKNTQLIEKIDLANATGMINHKINKDIDDIQNNLKSSTIQS